MSFWSHLSTNPEPSPTEQRTVDDHDEDLSPPLIQVHKPLTQNVSNQENIVENQAAMPTTMVQVPNQSVVSSPQQRPSPTPASIQSDSADTDHEQAPEQSCNSAGARSLERAGTLSTPTLSMKTAYESTRMMETPHRFARSSPKLVFLSETAPLEKLQETTLKRRRDLIARMHDLDCQVARLLSLYSEESMDFDLAIRDTLDRSVCNPLEASVERLVMERESSTQRGPAIWELEQRLSEIDNEMTKFQHVTLSDAKRQDLDNLYIDLFQHIIPSVHLEDAKSDKIEGGVIRRFENVAGIICRQFHQEAAARRASLELMKRRFEQAAEEQSQRGDDVLKTIQALRRKIQQERLQRQTEDKIILDDILRTTATMKRALLVAVGTGNE